MSSTTVLLLQRQLNIINNSEMRSCKVMTTKEIILTRIHPDEANIIMGHLLIEWNNGMSIQTTALLFA